ncbi:DUF2262 domain-containing protein [Bacillus toyonensis]|uniref:DUF2262 domain-containing protein n=1 Tax=Bacillus toyonensis TaxID=155322 RepID=UPI0003A62FE5|nr:DUF2262 domain-containing protein [Bacillus toyonensis]MBF7150044.1 DUF2262 domain-containing protein [Bacillus toyonensis]MDD9263885.1 DUF2262 domain-containing protein [Bacillus toyonensis]MED3186659.1 DUF2262 domain-containing protein [Bacillus toyonensis]TBX57690.1 DUF2262 domain-containing protein [Bacillus toyonensis]HDR3907994.1 DUF2262 domain-containing protein [Bacillus toyonensis]
MCTKLSKSSEISRFENRFSENVIEIAAVTGALGIGASKGGDNILWTASIDLIAWKDLHNNETITKEDIRLAWLVDDEEWRKSKDILTANTVVTLQVRKSGNSLMLVKVLETPYKDDELEIILQDAMKPVFYDDGILGEFELDKRVKTFEKRMSWAGEECHLYFDWNEDKHMMKSALETAHVLFKEQYEWNMKMKMYAAKELVELANEWLQDDDEAEIDEITKEMFIDSITLSSLSVYSEGDFEIFFLDGDIFWGHSIIVSGNIHEGLSSAEIAG